MSTFPEVPIGASIQSREDIIKYMASDECLYSYVDEHGASQELRPFVLMINELKNFLSFNPGATIEFLTDIYDRGGKVFNSSTIKRGLENIVNPCLIMLACEVPDWIIDKLKARVISGGFTRRMVYVYETESGPKITFPKPPPDSKKLWDRMQEHLRKIAKIVGHFEWTPGGREFYDRWYQSLTTPTDDVMEGYYSSKQIQLLKVAMLLALSEDEPKLLFTVDNLKQGIAMLDVIETNMPKLSIASGRNELALPMMKALDTVERHGGSVTPQELKIILNKDFTPQEYFSVVRSFTDCGQLVDVKVRQNGAIVSMLATRRKWNLMKANGELL